MIGSIPDFARFNAAGTALVGPTGIEYQLTDYATAKAAGVLLKAFTASTGVAFSGASGYSGAVDGTILSPEGGNSAYVVVPLGVGQGYARITYTANVRFASTDSVSFRIYVEDPSSMRYIELALIQSSSGAALKRAINSDGTYEAGGWGWYNVTWKLSDFAVTGTPNYSADFTLFQFQFGGVSNGGGQGRAAISNFRKNATSQSYILFTQDHGYDSVETAKNIFAASGIPLSVYVDALTLGDSGYLTAAQCVALRDHASGMFELASYPTYMATLAHTADGIALSQAVGGAGDLTLAGSLCTAGVANLGAARKVVLNTASAGGNRSVRFTITGTLAGNAVSETVLGSWVALGVESTNYYDTVTQIAVSGAITGNVIVGTSYSVAEHSAVIAAQIAAMQALGFTGAEKFIAYGGGQISEPLKAAIDANGVLLGRPNFQSQTAPRNMLLQDAAFNPLLLSAWNMGGAIATLKTMVDDVVNRGGVLVFYFHTIAASVDGVNPTIEDLASLVAYCKAYQNSGTLKCLKLSELHDLIEHRTTI